MNPKNEFIGADDLQKLIQDVADDEILVRLGFEIAVSSHHIIIKASKKASDTRLV